MFKVSSETYLEKLEAFRALFESGQEELDFSSTFQMILLVL